jgi:hypothetical protein
MPGLTTLIGYWQTEQYFKEHWADMKRIFLPKQNFTLRGLETLVLIKEAGSRSVFLTVRRTDYLNNTFHGGMLPLEYYVKALELVEQKAPNPHVFVFTDDVEWVQHNFKLPCQMTVGGNFDRTVKGHLGREDEELYLMSQCRHAIMANSSYSWWGAWLGENKDDRVVVAPARWFGPTSHEDPRDIVPERWIKI